MPYQTMTSDSVPSIPVARPIVLAAAPHPMLLAGATTRHAWRDLVSFLIAFVAVVAVLQTLAWVAQGADLIDDTRSVNVGLTFVTAFILLVAVASILRRRRQPIASIGLCGRPWWMIALFGVVALVGTWIVMYLTVLITCTLSSDLCASFTSNPQRIAELLPRIHPAGLCAIAVFVGIYEEIIFRGFLLTRLRKATRSAVAAVLLTSVLFAVPHALSQEPITVVPLCAAGVLWAVLTLWQRSVVPAIIGHALFDLCSLIQLYYFQPGWD